MAKYPDIEMLIGGSWRSSPGEDPITNPIDESILGYLPQASTRDLDDALAAAERGFDVWRKTPPAERARIIMRATSLMRERVDDMAAAITLEQGKPLSQAKMEIIRGCEILEWDAEEGRRSYGRVIPSAPDMQFIVKQEPIGVVAAFAPWNFPMSSPGRKVGGALAAGCSIILKPSEETPAGAYLMAKAFVDAGLPDGVLNLVYGRPAEISEYLIPHPVVRLITFTGSIPVGKKLAELAARYMKPSIMELGGHAPVIVCEDADPVATARLSVQGKSRNAGQVCVSPTRFFVHESIYDCFVDEFARGANALKVGDGMDPASEMGPLINLRRVEKIAELVSDAVAKGARVVAGGARIGNKGCVYPLTVLADVPEHAQAMQEEPFGPLALLSRVNSLDDAIKKANGLPYGLAAYAFTNKSSNLTALGDRLECGNLAVNHFTASFAETPFGGVKESGYGREGGTEGLACYMVTKLVSHKVIQKD